MDGTSEHAVILSAGLGKRMRRPSAAADLSDEARRIAETGCKAMLPMERPFVDYLVQALVDAGCRRLTFVIGPEHEELRRHVAEMDGKLNRLAGVRADVAVQEKPLGTADAVAAAREAVLAPGPGDEAAGPGERSFVVVNSDNWYPPSALAALRHGVGPALVAYDRDALIARSNIPAERIRRFAVLDIGPDGGLRRIVEKPDDPERFARGGRVAVSMNTWRFTPRIFDACGAIGPNPARGEYEITDAVQYAIDRLGVRFRCLPCSEGVLDLTERADIEPVARALADKRLGF